jgi:hypothetical protein
MDLFTHWTFLAFPTLLYFSVLWRQERELKAIRNDLSRLAERVQLIADHYHENECAEVSRNQLPVELQSAIVPLPSHNPLQE